MDSPEVYMYRSVIGLFATEKGFAFQWIGGYENVRSSVYCFAMIDKTRPQSEADPEGEVAGMVSYICLSTVRSSADVGYLITVPPYEQFYVMVHTIKLLLHYALDRHTASDLESRMVFVGVTDMENNISFVV
jgi:hypothetical protein